MESQENNNYLGQALVTGGWEDADEAQKQQRSSLVEELFGRSDSWYVEVEEPIDFDLLPKWFM